MAEMIEQLAARAFQARNIAHREHLKTRSSAQHVALNEFYEGVVDAIDTVVEVYQGRYGLISIPKIEDIPVVPNVAAYLLTEATWVENNRDKFAKCQAVLNRIDDLTAVYLRANYKLTHLL